MRASGVICFIFLVIQFAVSAGAQEKAEDVEKQKQRQFMQLTEQVLGEVPNLKLSENRSFVYAKVGNILWQSDTKQARTLFQSAIGEMANVLQAAVAGKKNDPYHNEILNGQGTRPQILNMIAARDAELALDALYKTRPAMVADALAYRPGKNTKISNQSNNYVYIAQNEMQLEQTLVRMAADQSPDRAAKLLKESLQKGLSQETFNLLNKLYEKDPPAADDLTTSIIDKLVKNRFMAGNQPDHQALNLANVFLNNFIQERPTNKKFVASDPGQMRHLAERLIAFYLEPSQFGHGYYLEQVLKFAEKLVPAAVSRLKQIQTEHRRRGNGDEHQEDINKLLGSELSPENLIAEAAKYPLNSRGRIFETAAAKFAGQGNSERARQVLEEIYSDDALDNALMNMSWTEISRFQNDGRFADAERVIDQLPENNRFSALINLANAAFEKNRDENRAYSMAVLAKARLTIPDRPENSSEMSNIMQIVSAYATIDAGEAFRLLGGLVPQLNELADASVVLYGFQGSSNIRQGEMMMSQGNSIGFHMDQSIFTRLAEKDFARASGLIDGFTRRETRILLKLQFVESGQQNLPAQGRQFRNHRVIVSSH